MFLFYFLDQIDPWNLYISSLLAIHAIEEIAWLKPILLFWEIDKNGYLLT